MDDRERFTRDMAKVEHAENIGRMLDRQIKYARKRQDTYNREQARYQARQVRRMRGANACDFVRGLEVDARALPLRARVRRTHSAARPRVVRGIAAAARCARMHVCVRAPFTAITEVAACQREQRY